MSDSQKTIDRIRTLLQRTEANGASEAEENTAARMVCKLLRQHPQLLQPVPTLEDIEEQRHRAANYARPSWRPDVATHWTNQNTASSTPDIDTIREFFSGRMAPQGYVPVRYTRLCGQNETEILLLVETKNGYDEVWLPTNRIKIRTRIVWVDEPVAKDKNLLYR